MLRELRWLRWERWREAPEADEAGVRPFARGAMAAGLVAVVVLCLFFPVPRPGTVPAKKLLLIAGGLLFDAIAVSVVAALAVSGLRAALSKGPMRVSGMTLRATWVTALWVPAWVFALERPSLATMVAGCLLMATGMLYLRRYGRSAPDAGFSLVERRAEEEESGLLRYPTQLDSKLWVKVLLPSIGLALLLELTATVAAMSWFRWASLLAGACAAAVVWRARSEESGEPSNRRAVAALALAFVFTLVVLLPYLKPTAFRAMALNPMLKERDAAAPAAATEEGFSGIVLLSPAQEHKKIELPVKKETETATFTGRLPQSVEIPFDGAYWYFKAPDKKPRSTAHVVKGSSTKATIRSTDWYPLVMEAHQRLGTAIDLSCCGAIDIVLEDADRREGAISLELWVRGKEIPDGRGYYLGTANLPLSEMPVAQRGNEDTPVEERVSFVVPSRMAGVRFDEFAVAVRTPPSRWREGPKIGIRKFVLEP